MKRAWNELDLASARGGRLRLRPRADLSDALERGLEWCGALLTVAVGLPLLVLAAVLLRGVLLVAAIVSVIGSIGLFCASSRFRGWVKRI